MLFENIRYGGRIQNGAMFAKQSKKPIDTPLFLFFILFIAANYIVMQYINNKIVEIMYNLKKKSTLN
jgi:hypothetical protein